MKVPLSWLKEYLDLPHTPRQIAEAMTLGGLEVDAITEVGAHFSGVVVGRVVEVHPHPNADRLRVARVSDGKEEFQIVCGASNCRAGIKSALARVGASLKDETGKVFKIKKGKLRDVESHGMLCSGKELGLSEEAEGILELPLSAVEGEDLSSLYRDVVFEISLTPNLGHCHSILGVARELSALLNIPLKSKEEKAQESAAGSEVRVHLLDQKQCLRYSCRVVTKVTVGPSPEWMKRRLELCGLRSVNNVVDVGNLVMLELGQPLHMFDYEAVEGGEIFVSSHTPYEKLETLDGAMRPIPKEVLLIWDRKKPLAFAGVIGGKESAVTEKTKTVLIESAFFTPQAIRSACKRLGVRTDASYRFERGVDLHGVVRALERASALLGGECHPVADLTTRALTLKKLSCRLDRINQMLGTSLSVREVVEIFHRLGFSVLEESQKALVLLIPSYRNDVSEEIDLIEEVARIYGYQLIPKKRPLHVTSPTESAPIYLFETRIRSLLMQEGLQELLTCGLISPAQAEMTAERGLTSEAFISVLQPRSVEQSILRTSMLASLLQVVKYNCDHQNKSLSGFEVGRIHFRDGAQYKEHTTAAIVLTGKGVPYHYDPKPADVDFYDLKGIVENVLEALKVKGMHIEVSHLHNFHPGRQARVQVQGRFVGALGEVHPSHLKQVGIDQRVFFAEINLHDLFPLVPRTIQVKELPVYPSSERDWTVTVREEVLIQHLLDRIVSCCSPRVAEVLFLDLYKSDQIGKDRKNVTFRFIYRDPEKTLSFEAVEKEHAELMQGAAEKLKEWLAP